TDDRTHEEAKHMRVLLLGTTGRLLTLSRGEQAPTLGTHRCPLVAHRKCACRATEAARGRRTIDAAPLRVPLERRLAGPTVVRPSGRLRARQSGKSSRVSTILGGSSEGAVEAPSE